MGTLGWGGGEKPGGPSHLESLRLWPMPPAVLSVPCSPLPGPLAAACPPLHVSGDCPPVLGGTTGHTEVTGLIWGGGESGGHQLDFCELIGAFI